MKYSALLLAFSLLEATPDSVFWTNCTTDVYDVGEAHIDEDNFFTLFNGSFFPPDTGIEFGIFALGDWSVEAGLDYLGGTETILLNAGIGIDEDKLFKYAPSFKAGFFNAGARSGNEGGSNQYVGDLIAGRSLPDPIGGDLYIGFYFGERTLVLCVKSFWI